MNNLLNGIDTLVYIAQQVYHILYCIILYKVANKSNAHFVRTKTFAFNTNYKQILKIQFVRNCLILLCKNCLHIQFVPNR